MEKLTLADFTWMTSPVTLQHYYEHKTSGGSICIDPTANGYVVTLYGLNGTVMKRVELDITEPTDIKAALEKAVEVANTLV